MKAAPFEHHAPQTAAQALALLAALGDDAKVLAGGQSLLPMLAMRLTGFAHLIDLNCIPEIRGISLDGDDVVIGAMTRQRELLRDPLVQRHLPLMRAAAPLIGHLQIRNRGTVGGSLAHADPASELPAVALVLGARFELRRTDGSTRTVAAADFFEGLWTTAIGDDELLTAIRFPIARTDPAVRQGDSIAEVARRHGDFAIAGAAAHVGVDGDGRITAASIALFGVANTAVLLDTNAAALVGVQCDGVDVAAVAVALTESLTPPDDLHATGAQRTRIARHLCAGVLTEAFEGANRARD